MKSRAAALAFLQHASGSSQDFGTLPVKARPRALQTDCPLPADWPNTAPGDAVTEYFTCLSTKCHDADSTVFDGSGQVHCSDVVASGMAPCGSLIPGIPFTVSDLCPVQCDRQCAESAAGGKVTTPGPPSAVVLDWVHKEATEALKDQVVDGEKVLGNWKLRMSMNVDQSQRDRFHLNGGKVVDLGVAFLEEPLLAVRLTEDKNDENKTVLVGEDMGCRNWKDIFAFPRIENTYFQACKEACLKLPECTDFSFNDEDGMCESWKGTCMGWNDEGWKYYTFADKPFRPNFKSIAASEEVTASFWLSWHELERGLRDDFLVSEFFQFTTINLVNGNLNATTRGGDTIATDAAAGCANISADTFHQLAFAFSKTQSNVHVWVDGSLCQMVPIKWVDEPQGRDFGLPTFGRWSGVVTGFEGFGGVAKSDDVMKMYEDMSSIYAASTYVEGEQDPSTSTLIPGAWAVNYADACSGTEVSIDLCVDLPPCGECQPQECIFSAWKDWGSGDCTGLCERQRSVDTANNECGTPCTGSLIETSNQSSCQTSPCLLKQDCQWDDWSDWGGCSCTCGGGQHQRDRHIKSAPIGGGKLCDPLTRTEVGPCNTHACGEICTDGVWGDWEEWGQCTHSCGGGAQVRSRNVKVEASACGLPVEGLRQEFQPCNALISCVDDVDCLLGEWGVWSDCTCTCNGVKRRSRRIDTYGRGAGAWCVNSTKEIAPCNMMGTAPGCKGEKVIDCVMSDWQKWSACSKDCGGGQTSRLRRILTEPKGQGRPCLGPLGETGGCNSQACMINGTMPIDCTWGDWSDWGACDKCNGQRHRFRNIKAMAEFGGKNCHLSDTEETDRCARNCHGPLWCNWGDWSEYSRCTKTCGKGTTRRERHLSLTEGQPADDGIVEEYSVMNDKMSEFEAVIESRPKDLATSFAAGFFSLVAGFGVLRLFRRSDDSATYQQTRQAEFGDMGAMLGPDDLE